MRLVHRTCALLGVVSLVPLPRAANAQQDSALPPLHAIDRANFDTTCAPCRDFFGYVNGGWLARTTIPPQYTMTGVDRDIQDRTDALLRRILNDAASAADTAKDADTRLVGRFYGSCMDSARVERESAHPLQGRLDQIAAIRSRAELAGLMG